MPNVGGIADKDLISKAKDKLNSIDQARQTLKRKWLTNVMMLYGQQYFTITKKTDQGNSLTERMGWAVDQHFSDTDRKRRTSNYILPLFRSLHSRFLSMKASIKAEPTTSDKRDKDASRVACEVGEDFWRNANRNNPWKASEYSGMQAVLSRVILYEMSLGQGYVLPVFNPKAETMLYDKDKNEVYRSAVGEAETEVFSVLDVFSDRFGRYTIDRRYISPEQVDYEYDVKVEPCKMDDDSTVTQIRRLLEGSIDEDEKEGEGVYVYRKICVPTKEYPDGQLLVFTDREVLYNDVLPAEMRRKNPMREFRYQDLGFSKYAQGAVEQVVDLQQDYNSTITEISNYKKLGKGKLSIPRGAKMNAVWDDTSFQKIFYNYGFKPEYIEAPSPPQYMFEDLKRIKEDMENLMNSHDSSMGRTPGQVKSGVGIANLADIDNAQVTPELIQMEQKLSFFMEDTLNIAQEQYNERRLIDISGDDLAFEVRSFVGSELFGQKRIKVSMGASLPINKADRQEYLFALLDKGIITQAECKDLLEFGDIEGIYLNLDETGAKADILNIIDGNFIVQAELWEDHTIRLTVYNDFRKTPKYEMLPPDKRTAIDQLCDEHQKMLLDEQAAAAQMGGGLPLPAKPMAAAK